MHEIIGVKYELAVTAAVTSIRKTIRQLPRNKSRISEYAFEQTNLLGRKTNN